MSHDGSWRAACIIAIHFLWFRFETPSVARGVTDPGVGSGGLFGVVARKITETNKSETSLEDTAGSGFCDRIASSIELETRTDSPFLPCDNLQSQNHREPSFV
jgi:hypothetical protein